MLPSITASHCKRNPNVDTSDIRNTTYVNFVRSVTIPSGTTYRYVFAPPSDTTKPYLLFIHGFPETSYDWSHQITYFTEQGYGVIVPDLLGCGGTDTPRALTLYGFKNMAADVGQILDCEGVEKVIGVSHDLGSPLLSRFVISQPSRFTAVAFLGNGYFPPAARVDAAGVDFINEAALSRFGYETVGFWSFNNEENAAKVFDQHLESFSTLSFTRNTSLWIDHLAPTGAIRQWLMQDKMATDIFVSRARMEQWKTIIRENGGMDGPLRWYKAMIAGVNNPTEEELKGPGTISLPVLLVLAERDPVAIPSVQLSDTVPNAPNLRVRSVSAGHFLQLEAPYEINRHLELFFQDVLKIPVSKSDSIAVSFEY
ncbi:hypothetical protein BFJ63_vAg13825 [Fusarium oxysporum f. sp. narcissi]|uniref:AB hydrolase-1 domain-containing protein n=1 Tax=Fusarium oxysporum f. sp. narcissi TaxID=451672 RepID=A0A4V1RYZ2_FUSOX|nr:hypothetical protein BFJ63_vAg13825 [Fusarium oxysporum f. sp. narcissi]